MKTVYPNLVPLASHLDRVAELEQLCRSKIGELLQAYLDAEVEELIQRRRYKHADTGSPAIHATYRHLDDCNERALGAAVRQWMAAS